MSDAPGVSVVTHKGEGRVEKISKDSVTLSHGPIASIKWGAMTMDFKLPKEGAPAGISEGNTVNFEFVPRKDGEFEITTIAPIANAAGMKK